MPRRVWCADDQHGLGFPPYRCQMFELDMLQNCYSPDRHHAFNLLFSNEKLASGADTLEW